MSLISTARVATDRPARYAKQLTSHFSRKVPAQWDEEAGSGSVTFAGLAQGTTGEVQINAGEGVLLLHLEAEESAALDRLELVVARHLIRFGRKDDLSVEFVRADGERGLVYTVADLDDDGHGGAHH